jgi:NarL family two-component system sensor histidine kinase LiaS
MAEQLQQLLKTKEDLATLEERNRLARDLHDSVKQQVFATTMQIGAAKAMLGHDVSKAEMHMNQAEELSRQAQLELGTLIRELRPVTLSEAGFVPALREYANDWAQQNAIDVELAVSETPGMDKLVEQALFRITQEALANVSRHSQASSVRIELSGINSEIVLSIIDDGIGFDMPEVSDNGMGLANMRERMRSVGGQLQIESQSGGGTRITAKLEGEQ